MGRERTFSREALAEAESATVKAMKQEAVSLQTYGKNISPHDLADAQMSLMGIFHGPSTGAEILSRVGNAHFRAHTNDALVRAYRFGIAHALGDLGIKENAPRLQAA